MAQMRCTTKVYDACDLFDGNPCAPCQQYINLEADIVAVEARMSAAKQAILKLETRKKHIREEINHIHDPITSQLPSEIVSEIFKSTLTRISGMGLDNYTIDSPLFLGAVCRSWRNIAWSSPSLWNWIHIPLRSPASKNFPELIEEWLDRSGQLPLMIYISCPKFFYDVGEDWFEEGEFDSLVHSVNQQSIRWKRVCLECPPSLVSLLCGNSRGAPNLQMLTLDPTNSWHRSYFCMAGPAQPSHVTLSYWSLKRMDITWNHVTDVYAGTFTFSDCIELVQRAPQLIHCRFIEVIGDREDRPFSIPNEGFVHQALQTLEFGSTEFRFDDYEPFFDSITFPSLTHLTLQFPIPDATFLWESSIKTFITRSCYRLISLVLQCPSPIESLVEVLETIPSLLTLELDLNLEPGDNGYDLFGLLARTHIPKASDEGDGPLVKFLPNLEMFTYTGSLGVDSDEATVPWTSILDVFGPLSEIGNPDRRPLGHLIIKTRFENYPTPVSIDSESLKRLLELANAGISLQLLDEDTEEDLIKLPMAHHGISTPLLIAE